MQRAKAVSQRQESLAAFKASGKSVKQWCDQSGFHRATVYRWLRQEAKAKATNVKSSKIEDNARVPPKGAATIKWLPITEKGAVNIVESSTPDKSSTPITDGVDVGEIRVQIGIFTIIAPDGFRTGTFKSVCEALMDIC